jgi:hypothetical protein
VKTNNLAREGRSHSPGNLLPKSVPVPNHAFRKDALCVLCWSPDRRLVSRRKIGLNFVLANRSIGRKLGGKLFRINPPLLDSGPFLRQRYTTPCSEPQNHSN